MPKVSIIVAAYNIEKYIIRCLDSLINQTFKDIEIIVVNDGSIDNTLQKIKELSKNDKRIKVIDKQNGGLIEARKSGFKEARGSYVLFIDGDDWLKSNTIEILYNKAIENNYDIVCYKFLCAYDDGKLVKSNQISIDEMNEYDFLKEYLLGNVIPSIWSKFIKKSFIDDNNIVFPENISVAEDLAFSCSLGIYKPKSCVIDEYLYYYYQRDTSLGNEISKKTLELNEATKFIKTQLENKNLLHVYRYEFEYLAFIHNYLLKRDAIYGNNIAIGKQLHKNWRKMSIDIYKNKYCKKIIHKIPFKGKILFILFEKNYMVGRLYTKYIGR